MQDIKKLLFVEIDMQKNDVANAMVDDYPHQRLYTRTNDFLDMELTSYKKLKKVVFVDWLENNSEVLREHHDEVLEM